jgi:hypothetical protein
MIHGAGSCKVHYTMDRRMLNLRIHCIGYLQHALACNLKTAHTEEVVQQLGTLNAQVGGVCEAR